MTGRRAARVRGTCRANSRRRWTPRMPDIAVLQGEHDIAKRQQRIRRACKRIRHRFHGMNVQPWRRRPHHGLRHGPCVEGRQFDAKLCVSPRVVGVLRGRSSQGLGLPWWSFSCWSSTARGARSIGRLHPECTPARSESHASLSKQPPPRHQQDPRLIVSTRSEARNGIRRRGMAVECSGGG